MDRISMAKVRLTVQLCGSHASMEHVRFSDFLFELDAIKGALLQLDKSLMGKGHRTVDFRVVGLSHSSPALIEIEAVQSSPETDNRESLITGFLLSLQSIVAGKLPEGYDSLLLEQYKRIGKRLTDGSLELTIFGDHTSIRIEPSFESKVVALIGDDLIEDGIAEGSLELINLHRDANRFHIFPIVGPEKVVCHFPGSLLAKAIEGVGRNVQVAGKSRKKAIDKYPHAIEASSIFVAPEESHLPSIMDLRGLIPKILGGKRREDFIRS